MVSALDQLIAMLELLRLEVLISEWNFSPFVIATDVPESVKWKDESREWISTY